jgi:deoxyribodipyrimidine photolyase-like uncharacterized protein
MILSNFALLTQIEPKEIYNWFLSFVSIDAYEWVMEPNVYGMGIHSVGQLMMNRPYFSSSNYLFKMSGNQLKKNNLYNLSTLSSYYFLIIIYCNIIINIINSK